MVTYPVDVRSSYALDTLNDMFEYSNSMNFRFEDKTIDLGNVKDFMTLYAKEEDINLYLEDIIVSFNDSSHNNISDNIEDTLNRHYSYIDELVLEDDDLLMFAQNIRYIYSILESFINLDSCTVAPVRWMTKSILVVHVLQH